MDIKEKIITAIQQAANSLQLKIGKVSLEHPTEPEHGDYSTNIGMTMFVNLKFKIKNLKLNSPLEIAEKIVEELNNNKELTELIERIEVVKPGFINFFLSPKLLASEVVRCIEEGERYGQSEISKQKIVIEHTSPNTNKPLHVGHIRNNVTAMSVIRLLQAVGNEVVPVEIINDRGAHIMQSMWGYLLFGQKENRAQTNEWKDLLEKWSTNPSLWRTPDGEKEWPIRKPDHFVGHFYVRAEQYKTENEKNGEYVKSQIQEMLQSWEAGDEKVRKLWQQMNSWFYQGVKETYERLGSLESRRWFESEVYREGKNIVEQNIGKVFTRQEDGSVIANLKEKYNLPNCVVLRADGTAIYMTQDIALLRDRKEKLKADKLVYVVANEQALHFKQLFAIAHELEFGDLGDFYHLSYGMVRLATGPMSSRFGTVVNADELMDDTHGKAGMIVGDAGKSKDFETIEEEAQLAEVVGLGAIKYSMLNYHPAGDILFDEDKSISLEGNSGPYLQYTYARTQSLLAKAMTNDKWPMANKDDDLVFSIGNLALNGEELSLLRHTYKFSEVVQAAAQNYSPNLLCNFLFELAQRYNTFYNKHRIIGADRLQTTDYSRNKKSSSQWTVDSRQTFRLALTRATGTILKSGLGLLGIQAPERM